VTAWCKTAFSGSLRGYFGCVPGLCRDNAALRAAHDAIARTRGQRRAALDGVEIKRFAQLGRWRGATVRRPSAVRHRRAPTLGA